MNKRVKKTFVFLCAIFLLLTACSAPTVSQTKTEPAPSITPAEETDVLSLYGSDGKLQSTITDKQTIDAVGTLLQSMKWTEAGQNKGQGRSYRFKYKDAEYDLNIGDNGCIIKNGQNKAGYLEWKDGASKLCLALGIKENVPDVRDGNIFVYGELSEAAKAVINSRGDQACFAVYQEMPFEDGTLVLAGFTEGGAYPNLYFVDESNKVAFETSGSDCYMLNYTQFKNKTIFFGKAAVEKLSDTSDSTKVINVAAKYNNEKFSAQPYPAGTLIAVKNPQQSEKKYGENAQGYILASGKGELPDTLDFELDGGKAISASGFIYEREAKVRLPGYLNTEGLRETCVYKYCPMFSAEIIKALNDTNPILLKRKEMESEAAYIGNVDELTDEALTAAVIKFARSFRYINNSFPAGSHVSVISPEGSKISCYAVRLTNEVLESSSVWQFKEWPISINMQIKMPGAGYYLFVLCVQKPSDGYDLYMGIDRIK